jgi:hypothetical protein
MAAPEECEKFLLGHTVNAPIDRPATNEDAQKPVIIVLSDDDEPEFSWMSSGWYTQEKHGTEEGERLFALAQEQIGKAQNVPEAIKLLEAAGFKVTRLDEPDNWLEVELS